MSGAGAGSGPDTKKRRTETVEGDDPDPRPPFPTSIHVRWDRLFDTTRNPHCYVRDCEVCSDPPKSVERLAKGHIPSIQIGSVWYDTICVLTIQNPLDDCWLRKANVSVDTIRAFAGTDGASLSGASCKAYAEYPLIMHSTLYGFGCFGMGVPIDGDELPYRSRPPPGPDVKLFREWRERFKKKNAWEEQQFGFRRSLSVVQVTGEDGSRRVRFNGPWPNGLAWKTIKQPKGWAFTQLNAVHVI